MPHMTELFKDRCWKHTKDRGSTWKSGYG